MKSLFAIALLTVATSAAAQGLTPEQTLDRRSLGDLEFSPDGSRLVFAVTDPPSGAVRPRSLWMLDVPSGQLRRLTAVPGKSDSSPRWSSDGQSIAFISDRDGAPRLFVLPMGGGEADALLDAKEAVTTFRWSPDSQQIAVLMAEPKPPALDRRVQNRDDARVVDKDERHGRIWLVNVASRSSRQLTRGSWRIRQIEWSPSGDRLIASATNTPEADKWSDRLYGVSLTDGAFTEIAAPRGPLGPFAVAPNGETLAYVGT